MKRKQKRYTTEKQILDKIDYYRKEAQRCLEESTLKDQEVRDRIKEGGLGVASIVEAQQESERLLKRRARIEETTIPKLKDALAEFRTMLLPITDDPGVVIH